MKLSDIEKNKNKFAQKKSTQKKEQKQKTAISPLKKQKSPTKKPQKKTPVKKYIQDNQQNQTARNNVYHKSKKNAYSIFLSNVKIANKKRNNHTSNSTKKKTNTSSLSTQYKNELKKSDDMIESMLKKIASLKAEQDKQNMTIDSPIYLKTEPNKKTSAKKNKPISIDSKTTKKPKKNNNLYNLYNENEKNMSAHAKIGHTPKISTERNHKNNINTSNSYDQRSRNNIIKKGISVNFETYDYDKLLEFDAIKNDKRLKNELNKLISENKELRRVASCFESEGFFQNITKNEKEEKFKTDKKHEKNEEDEKEAIDEIEAKKINDEQKTLNDQRRKNILRRYINKKEKDIKNILRMKFFEFYYKSKIESIITEKRTDKSSKLNPKNKKNKIIWNKIRLCNKILNKNNNKSINNNLNYVGSNLNKPNNIANNSNKKIKEANNNYNQNTIITDNNIKNNTNTNNNLNIQNNKTENNKKDNNLIISQTSTTQNNEINNDQENNLQTVINPENNTNNTHVYENLQAINISNNNINNDQNNNIINEVPNSEKQTIPQEIVSNKKTEDDEKIQKKNRLEKSRKLRRLLAAKEQGRKETLKKYFIKFLINGIFTLNQLRTFRRKALNGSGVLNMVKKEGKLTNETMMVNFIKKNITIIIEQQKKEEKEKINLKKQEFLFSFFSKKDQKITMILRSKLRDYNVRAKIESLAEYKIKFKHKKSKKKKSNNENDKTTEKKDKKDKCEIVSEKNEGSIENVKSD